MIVCLYQYTKKSAISLLEGFLSGREEEECFYNRIWFDLVLREGR